MPEQTSRARRGRHAEAARNDRLVLDAARDVFASQGARAPISAVAARAGVGVGSLYRRYGSKTELLAHVCILAMEEAIAAAEEGLQHQDAWAGLAHYVHRCVAFRSGALAPLAGTFDTTPKMWNVARHSRRLLDRLVEQAHVAGALRRDATAVDISYLIQQFAGPHPNLPRNESEAIRHRLLALALDGLRAPGHTPLPGPVPSREAYEAAWGTRSP